MGMNMAEHAAICWSAKVNWLTMQSHDSIITPRVGTHLQCYMSQCSEQHSEWSLPQRPQSLDLGIMLKLKINPALRKHAMSHSLRTAIIIYTSVSQPVVLEERVSQMSGIKNDNFH